MPIGSRDECVSLATLLTREHGDNARVHQFDEQKLKQCIAFALRSNNNDSLSVLLGVLRSRRGPGPACLRDGATVRMFVGYAVEAEAAECLLMLLNAVRTGEEETAAAATGGDAGAAGAPTLSQVDLLRIAREATPNHESESEMWGRAFSVEDGGKAARLQPHVSRLQPHASRLPPLCMQASCGACGCCCSTACGSSSTRG